jgi:hypothetical protein
MSLNSIITKFLAMTISEKAAFAFVVFTSINQAIAGLQKGNLDELVDSTYKYLPAKYAEKASVDEIKAAIKSYIDAYNKTEALFKK